MIKNIVFDLGNVLINFKPEKYLERTLENKSLVNMLCKAIFNSPEWLELDRGSISLEEAINLMCEKNMGIAGYIRTCMKNYHNMFTPVSGTVKTLEILKRNGFRLYYLSNFHLKAFNYIFNEYEFFSLFDGGVVSSHVNLLKPQKEIYEMLISKYGLVAGETLFIDDTLENIISAGVLGFKTLHFKDVKDANKIIDMVNQYITRGG
ncbi:MAG: HAD family phosphatase [Clostridiaceae bacterium]|nr:HAD family phosphatase [Clostridiaceae bacterium]